MFGEMFEPFWIIVRVTVSKEKAGELKKGQNYTGKGIIEEVTPSEGMGIVMVTLCPIK